MSFLNSTYELYKAFKEPQGIKVLSQNHIGEQDTAYLNKSRTRARARSRSRARIGSGPETCGPYKDSVAWLPDKDCWAYPGHHPAQCIRRVRPFDVARVT